MREYRTSSNQRALPVLPRLRKFERPLCECGNESWQEKQISQLHSSTRDRREEAHMTFISIFHHVRRKGRDRVHTEIVEADDGLANDSAEQLPMVKDELTAYFQVLDERISKLNKTMSTFAPRTVTYG